MFLSDHLDRIQLKCAKAAQQHNWPLKKLFCSGLLAVLEYKAEYDQIVDEQNPFYKEFALCSQRDAIGEDELFSMFECLVIFIRMRQVANPAMQLSSAENHILHYFETCGEWSDSDNTVVCHWYWKRLPESNCSC